MIDTPEYEVLTTGKNRVRAYCYNEDDAEEVGAALAKVGFEVEVYWNGKLLHEFFPS